tara:strand:- start:72680 stop:73498 length:819 start_codon:yes stop_codon:yes gene_type:complete
MPELPEVETIRKQLSEYLPLKITKVEKSDVLGSILKEESFQLKNKVLESISRTGKLMDFFLGEGHHMLSHLGMSGSWRISHKKITVKHTHLQLYCLNNKKEKIFLAYVDPRRFGNIYINTKEETKKHYKKLGIDIASDAFTEDYIWECIKKFPNKEIKPFLLEQKYFAGVGNYIASEICARAKIKPTRKNKSLKKKDSAALLFGTKSILEDTIANNGTTFSGGYSDANGEKGEGVKNLVVFYQTICGMCKKTPVTKITQATRGTYYCPICQK